MIGFDEHLTILGGGPAGIAAGFYAAKKGISFKIYEANNRVGGNSITFKNGEFYYDSGAHRFHDKISEVTEDVMKIMGNDMQLIDVPSKIYYKGKFVDFPLSPLNLLLNYGFFASIKSVFEILLHSTLQNSDLSFADVAKKKYGTSLANSFLLNYSQKLWGLSPDKLSPQVSGKRLKGLDLKTVLKEIFRGSKEKTEHLDGKFYYPKYGIGMIMDKLSADCGMKNIFINSKVSEIKHELNKIKTVIINNNEIRVNEVFSTLPLKIFLECLNPQPPPTVLQAVQALKFRHIRLAVIFLNKEQVTNCASIYFPDMNLPFTRIYEPKNRSPFMSPQKQTSLVIEIPFFANDTIAQKKENILFSEIKDSLVKLGLIKNDEIEGYEIRNIYNAYPVLEMGFEKNLKIIMDYLDTFTNLKLVGRTSSFQYNHIHDLMFDAMNLVNDFCKKYQDSSNIKMSEL